MSRKVFVLDNKLRNKYKLEHPKKERDWITYDQIEGILERTVTKQGTSAKADVPRRYLGKRVYVIITKSEGEAERE